VCDFGGFGALQDRWGRRYRPNRNRGGRSCLSGSDSPRLINSKIDRMNRIGWSNDLGIQRISQNQLNSAALLGEDEFLGLILRNEQRGDGGLGITRIQFRGRVELAAVGYDFHVLEDRGSRSVAVRERSGKQDIDARSRLNEA